MCDERHRHPPDRVPPQPPPTVASQGRLRASRGSFPALFPLPRQVAFGTHRQAGGNALVVVRHGPCGPEPVSNCGGRAGPKEPSHQGGQCGWRIRPTTAINTGASARQRRASWADGPDSGRPRHRRPCPLGRTTAPSRAPPPDRRPRPAALDHPGSRSVASSGACGSAARPAGQGQMNTTGAIRRRGSRSGITAYRRGAGRGAARMTAAAPTILRRPVPPQAAQ